MFTLAEQIRLSLLLRGKNLSPQDEKELSDLYLKKCLYEDMLREEREYTPWDDYAEEPPWMG